MRASLRSAAVAGLLIVASLLALTGGIAVYGRAVLTNENRFSDRLAETLRSSTVQDVVARSVTDRIEAGHPDLIGVRPVIRAASRAVVRSRPFQTAVHAVGTDLHGAMFDRDRRSVTLTVAGAVVLVVQTLQRTHPDVARRIPPGIEGTLVRIATLHASVTNIARKIDSAGRYGLWALLLALLAAGGAVLLAADRRRALIGAGSALAVAGLVDEAAGLLARHTLLTRISGEDLRAAAGAAWHVLAGGLEAWGLAAMVAGLVLVAGATLWPGAAPRRRVRPAGTPRLRRGGLLLGGTALLATTFFVARGAAAPNPARYSETACNGHAELCHRRLNDVAFAATHNSMAAGTGWFFSQHEAGIPSQLRAGIRGLLIDTHYGVKTARGVATDLQAEGTTRAKLVAQIGKPFVRAAERLRGAIGYRGGAAPAVYLCHGACEVGATPVVGALESIRDFAVAHPREVILISIEDEVTPADTVKAFRRSGLLPFVYAGSVSRRWPTLGELIDSGRRIVVFGENKTGDVPWYRPQFKLMQETPFGFRSAAAVRSPASCRANRGPAGAKLFLLNNWIDTPPANRPSEARKINGYDALLARARACERRRHRIPNLVAVDFYRVGDVVRVVDTLNGVRSD
jgi:hypothetical protein